MHHFRIRRPAAATMTILACAAVVASATAAPSSTTGLSGPAGTWCRRSAAGPRPSAGRSSSPPITATSAPAATAARAPPSAPHGSSPTSWAPPPASCRRRASSCRAPLRHRGGFGAGGFETNGSAPWVRRGQVALGAHNPKTAGSNPAPLFEPLTFGSALSATLHDPIAPGYVLLRARPAPGHGVIAFDGDGRLARGGGRSSCRPP